ncbi:MAG: hypothetical protein LBQ54_08350 [Planctomycetaceae bacterium]|jgi:hypothetical protein|nr:hypothetical protein [Planctomycetaceae bacterium]
MPGTELFLELMERKADIVDQLCQFAEKQLEIVRASDITLLLSFLSRKQHLIYEMEFVEKELTPFREEKPEDRLWASPEAKERCQERIDFCREKLALIMDLEHQAEKELTAKKENVRGQIKHLDQGVTVHRAYHKTKSADSGRLLYGLDLSSG